MDKPTPKELFAAYPAVTHAVAWVELIVCDTEPGEPPIWNTLAQHANCSPAWVVRMCVKMAEGSRDQSPAGKINEAIAEMAHPQFLQYIAGKLGAV